MMDNQVQVRRRPVIRVFVSSTFTDLKHERDALQRDVFPKLEQLCASRQFQFQAIDLRWGVPTEASLDHRTMRICFEELRRSQEISPQPNFLILLGNRYGWRPLPGNNRHPFLVRNSRPLRISALSLLFACSTSVAFAGACDATTTAAGRRCGDSCARAPMRPVSR